MNPFKQMIGIYYNDKIWADNIREQLIKDLRNDESIIWRITKYEILFKDGSYVRFVPANGKARGNRFTTSYIQDGIDYKTYCEIIAPANRNDQCYVINEYEGLFYYGRHYKASRYYETIDWINKRCDNFDTSFEKEYECVWRSEGEDNDKRTSD